MTRNGYAVLGVLVLLSPAVAQAQVLAPVGTEFQVNTYTTGYQNQAAVCASAAGNFVVVWESYDHQDGNGLGVFGQRYASSGGPLGTEFQVNTYTPLDQRFPDICCEPDGDFVAVWQSLPDQDGSSNGIFGQRFASNGTRRGTEFQVNTYTTDDQTYPAICCSATGDFVVTWNSDEQDGEFIGVFGQRFASSGVPQGTEFQVNTYTTGSQTDPAICCSAAGDFVVAWESLFDQDGSSFGVFGQRFDSAGAAQGTEFQVNTYTTDFQGDPAICCDTAGDFVVVWTSAIQDGSYTGVFGQRFASAGAPRGTEFQVNSYTTGFQNNPSVCCDSTGGFVVAWNGNTVSGQIFARRFNGAGVARGTEFQVNTYTSEFRRFPDVACDEAGGFVVVWSRGPSSEGRGDDVFGQRFELIGLTGTPTLSWLGLVAGLVALLGSGGLALRRRR